MSLPRRDTSRAHVRELTGADHEFLVEMVRTAAFWRPKPKGPRRAGRAIGDLLNRLRFRDYLAMYHEGWGRPGDSGFVANNLLGWRESP